MRKTAVIAKREINVNVRRKAFILGVIGFPLLIGFSFLVPVLFIQEFAIPKEYRAGIVDHASILNRSVIELSGTTDDPFFDSSTQRKIIFVIYESEEDARKAFQEGEIDGYYIIPENFQNSFLIKKQTQGLFDVDEKLELVISKKFGDYAYRFAKGISFQEIEEKKEAFDFVISMFIPLLLFMAIFTSSGYLMQGIIEEKESRVMEILLSSASPEEVFTGKFIGNAITGLIQASVWLGLAGLFSGFMLSVKLISFGIVVVSVLFFILGYLLYSSLLAAIASISSSLKEAQQATSIIVFIGLFPAIFLSQITSLNPESPAIKAFSLFPLTSPALMPALYSAGSTSLFDIVLGAVILALTSYLTLKLSSRIFRYYALTYSKPKWREIMSSINVFKSGKGD